MDYLKEGKENLLKLGLGGRIMLYHVSLRFWDEITKFIPRVPKGRLDSVGEDTLIPRICLSDSIEGCLTGVPWGGYNLIKDPPYGEAGLAAIFRLYEFDKSKIKKENLLNPQQIKKYVPDSEVSREHWVINQEIVPEKSYIVMLKDFYIEPVIIQYKDTKYRMYKIIKPKYEILKKEEEDLLVNLANSENKGLFFRKHKNEFLSVFK